MAVLVEQERSRAWVGTAGLRALASALDGVALVAILVLTTWVYAWNQPADGDSASVPAPAWFLPLVGLLWAVYLTLPTWLGATPGMRAVGLRVVRAGSHERLGLARSAVRSLALIAVVWALVAVRWWLLPLYGALMLLTAAQRLPHDLLAGSAVTPDAGRAEPPGTTPRAADLSAVDPAEARALLEAMRRTERTVRADLHVQSVGVLTLAVLALGGAAAALPDDLFSPLTFVYWAVAAPAGLVLVLVLSSIVQRRAGIRRPRGWLVVSTVLAFTTPVVGLFSFFGGVFAGLAFVGVAAHERSRLLAASAGAFALVVGVQQATGWFAYSLVSNRLPGTAVGDLMSEHGTAVVEGLLGLVLAAVALVAYRSERAAR